MRKVMVNFNDEYESPVSAYVFELPNVSGIEGVEAIGFTFENALEVARQQKALVDLYDNGNPDSFAIIEYDENEDAFNEVYWNGVYATSIAFEVDGIKLYPIGMEWDWEVVE